MEIEGKNSLADNDRCIVERVLLGTRATEAVQRPYFAVDVAQGYIIGYSTNVSKIGTLFDSITYVQCVFILLVVLQQKKIIN